MDLKAIILSKEASQKRPHVVWFHLYEVSEIGEPIVAEIRFIVF